MRAVGKIGSAQEAGWFYFVDDDGDVSRTMPDAQLPGRFCPPEKVHPFGLQREKGQHLWVDDDGTVLCAAADRSLLLEAGANPFEIRHDCTSYFDRVENGYWVLAVPSGDHDLRGCLGPGRVHSFATTVEPLGCVPGNRLIIWEVGAPGEGRAVGAGELVGLTRRPDEHGPAMRTVASFSRFVDLGPTLSVLRSESAFAGHALLEKGPGIGLTKLADAQGELLAASLAAHDLTLRAAWADLHGAGADSWESVPLSDYCLYYRTNADRLAELERWDGGTLEVCGASDAVRMRLEEARSTGRRVLILLDDAEHQAGPTRVGLVSAIRMRAPGDEGACARLAFDCIRTLPAPYLITKLRAADDGGLMDAFHGTGLLVCTTPQRFIGRGIPASSATLIDVARARDAESVCETMRSTDDQPADTSVSADAFAPRNSLQTAFVPPEEQPTGESDVVQSLRSAFPQFQGFTCPEQEAITRAFLHGDPPNLLGILPTGKGKSLSFLLPTYCWKRDYGRALTVVVSPLLALMQDQIDAIGRHNEDFGEFHLRAEQLNSSLDLEQRRRVRRAVRDGEVNVLYLGPETLLQPMVYEMLADAAANRVLRGLVVDEAHMIVEWGDEFRTGFRRMAPIRNLLQAARPDEPLRTLLLSATIPPADREDVLTSLGLDPATPCIERKEIRREHYLRVRPAKNWSEKVAMLVGDVRRLLETGVGVIYCSQREHCEELADLLNRKGLGRAESFHGRTSPDRRRELLHDFQANRIRVIVATCAFGLGVDKKDVRWVLHFTQPGSIDQYYQEIGRAGRDGQDCEATLYYVPADKGQATRNALKVLTTEKFVQRLDALRRSAIVIRDGQHGGVVKLLEESTPPDYAEHHGDQWKDARASRAHTSWNYTTLVRAQRHRWMMLGPDVLHEVACERVVGVGDEDLEARAPLLWRSGHLGSLPTRGATRLVIGQAAASLQADPRELQREFFDLLYAGLLRLPDDDAARYWDTRILVEDLVSGDTAAIDTTKMKEEDDALRTRLQRDGAERVAELGRYARSERCRRHHFHRAYGYEDPTCGCARCDVCRGDTGAEAIWPPFEDLTEALAINEEELTDDELEIVDEEDLGDFTVSSALAVGLEEQIAGMTGLTVRTVRRRLEDEPGGRLIRNVFEELWPADAATDIDELDEVEPVPTSDLAVMTIAEARRRELVPQLAELLELSPQQVERRMDQYHGATYIETAFAAEWDAATRISADELGDMTAADARAEGLAAEIAQVTRLSRGAVYRRLRNVHGRTLVRNVFEDCWATSVWDRLDELGAFTAAAAIAEGRALDISRLTALSTMAVNRRLNGATGNMLLRNLFAAEWPNTDEVLVERLARMNVATAREQNVAGLLARLTGLTVQTVTRKLNDTHGRMLLGNLFGNGWAARG